MVLAPQTTTYPDSDGKPMADNTKQFRWIVTIKENLEILFAEQANVFVAGDLLWYPVEGNNRWSQAPDAMVVFGRPKGDRGSYRQWEEDGIAPQVVFEILSPSNTTSEMARKLLFYLQYGVEEYYQYDPDRHELVGAQAVDGRMVEIRDWPAWVSPRLGIRFELTNETLNIYTPGGDRFLTPIELAADRDRAKAERDRAEAERDRVQAERDRAEAERDRVEAERDKERDRANRAEAERAALLARLRDSGIDPDRL